MTVLDKILEKRFFTPWREGNTGAPGSLWQDSNLELYVTAACNQNCEYCYLVRQKELYPREAMEPETIKENMKVFLDWCLGEGFPLIRLTCSPGRFGTVPSAGRFWISCSRTSGGGSG